MHTELQVMKKLSVNAVNVLKQLQACIAIYTQQEPPMSTSWSNLICVKVCNRLNTFSSSILNRVTTPQDAHKQFSAAGFPKLKHFKIQWYVGKNFGSI